MNWQYIQGFFDADGSITLARNKKGAHKTLQISFSNCERHILKEIKSFIKKELDINGFISKKKVYSENHTQNYELKYVYQQAHKLSLKLKGKHNRKIHRIEIYDKLQDLIPRNGKYSDDLLQQRKDLEEEFFSY